ncbi:MAG: zinc ribbon domain-containing protein [Bacteroidales bacterium]|nr:zinc ribbon domain-containing protein [Bacteroidales bacterium]
MEETKQCPYCRGTVLAVAKKCKHCGQWIEQVEMETCPICCEEIPKGMDICPYCKEDINTFRRESAKQTTTCPVCQEKIPTDAYICPYCHENIIEWGNCQSKQNDEKQDKQEKKTGLLANLSKSEKILLISTIIFLLGLVVYAIWPQHTENIKSDKDCVTEVLNTWSDSHNNKDLYQLKNTYGYTVKYYQSRYTREMVIASKEKLFKKDGDFYQKVDNIRVLFSSPDTAFVDFDKHVNNNKTYPSYLRLCKDNDGSWYIIEESDYVTDANLALKKNKNRR